MTPGPDEPDASGPTRVQPAATAQELRYAEAVLEARLGREPRDTLEATVVLEAWTGRRAREAMNLAESLFRLARAPVRARSRIDPFADTAQTSVVAEGVTLVLLIISIAAWAAPIRRELGLGVLPSAIRVALPIAIAMQWGLRSRYLGRPDGMICLARDGLRLVAAALVVEIPLALVPRWGPVAAILVAIWVGGAILTRHGWGLPYAIVLVACTIGLTSGLAPYAILGTLAGLTVAMCAVAVAGQRRATTEWRPGDLGRATLAAAIGGVVGVLLVADPSLSGGVHGPYPAIALLPSVIGSYWGGFYLWHFHAVIPQALRGASLRRAGRVSLADPAMAIFVGGMARLIVGTMLLTVATILLAHLTGETDNVTVYLAFGTVATVSMLLGLLESFALPSVALAAAGAALVVELAWPAVVGVSAPGAALAAGAATGALLTLPALISRLSQTGRMLATTLWIQ